MANNTSSSRKAKVDENNNGRHANEKGQTNSGPSASDATGLRRSARETSSKKRIPSPSSTQKSERIGKRTSLSPVVRRKSERVEKQKVPSPLRRSERTKNRSSLASSGSKSLGSSASKQKKQKKEKSVKQLTFEAKEVSENEKHDVGTSQVKRNRMNARAYRAMLKQKAKIDCHEESNRKDKLTQEGGNSSGSKIDECFKGSHVDCKEVSENGMLSSDNAKEEETRANSRLSAPVREPLENNETLVSLLPSNATKISGAPETVHDDCCREETLKKIGSRNSMLDEKLVRSSVGNQRGKKLTPSKRKGIMVDMHYDVSARISYDYNCNLIAGAAPLRLCECKAGYIVGTCGTCSKRIRADHDPNVQEGFSSNTEELVNPSATEDRGEIEASITEGVSKKGIDYMQQKEFSANIQTDDEKKCLICKCGGQLLFCDGKGCNGGYHLSCLEPPMVDSPVGVWHCHLCLRKKIESGVYSVSEGVESIWDAREVEVSNIDGSTTEKEFLVKYKGLAHVHNRWVPESQLLLEAPLLLKKFNKKDQALRWKLEWSLPHRLLQKRALISAKQHGESSSGHVVNNFDIHYEWLVKWRGLGYEHASWELDNASFLRSSEGQRLIRDYEDWHQRARRISLFSKVDKKLDRVSSLSKLSQMPGGVSSGFGNNNLDAVNKLREHWHKGQNAIVIDDHDRIVKVIAFILSLHSDTYQPFLIISTSAALHLWEDEFSRFAPSVNVVIYSGHTEMRESIRKLEFYEEGGCLLFQVLIVVPEIIVEDLDVLGGIEWEVIIVDECQCSKISSYLKQIKTLNTDMRLLLLSGQLKDSIVEYLNILALLDHQSYNGKDDELISNSSDCIAQLKDRLSSYVAYRCKSDSFRFVEYWVPVKISNIQLEQYCATLLSNASILRSSSKNDLVGALRDILITTRKCCNHPYLVDTSLQTLLTKDLQVVEYLDVGIKASGKLQLLDSMLMELRKQGLRGLILFQSVGGSGKDSIGDILDDFLRQRFGPDSYERVDKCVVNSKKLAALKMFNNKDHGRFVFLLETCACLPSIKLSSVDTIIIFDSDWNPMNDIRALQKITLDSQFEQIKIFRLYSSFTVEERALILAKQDKPFDSNLQNVSRSTSQMLLMWGASCLFDDLKAFHDSKTSGSSVNSLSWQSLLQVAIHEFSSVLKQDGEDNDTRNCSILLKVQQNGGTYRANFSLVGEGKFGSLDLQPSHMFWTNLLEGKHPQWKYSYGSSQRSRKRVQHFDGLVYRPDFESEDIGKKRRKLINNVVDQPSSKSEGGKLTTRNKEGNSVVNVSQFLPSPTACVGDPPHANHTSCSFCLADQKSERPRGNDVEYEKIRKLRDEQRSLHLSLKPEIAKLYEVLLLPDKVKRTADDFLEYVMNNHHVNKEPVSILQAFQLSLCWTAASLLKHKIDHKASLILAKQHLKFDCKKEEADYIYSMLRCLKKMFLYRTGNSKITGSPKASDSELSNRDYCCTGLAPEVELAEKDVSKSIKEIQKKCQKQLRKLLLKHQEEKNKLNTTYEEEKADLEKKYKIESAVIRSCTPNDVMRTEKLKTLDTEYTRRIEDLKCQHGIRLKDLEIVQLAARQKFQDREATWVEDVKSWARDELLNVHPSKEHGNGVECLKSSEQAEPDNSPKNVGLVSGYVADGKGFDKMVEAMTRMGVGSSKPPETISPVAVLYSNPVELQTPLVRHASANEDHDSPENACECQGNIISIHSSKDYKSNGATIMTNEREGHENFNRDGCREKTTTLVLPSSNGEICTEVISDVSNGEVSLEVLKTSRSTDSPDEVPSSRQGKLDQTVPSCGFSLGEVKAVGSSDCVKNNAFLNSQSPEELIQSGIAVCVPTCDSAAQFHEAHDNNESNNAVTLNSPLSVERTAAGAAVSVLNREFPVGMIETVNFTDGSEPVITVDTPSSMEQNSDGGAVNVSDRVSSRLCDNPPLPEQQTFDGVSLSIHDGQLPVEVPETSHEVAECHNDRQHQTDTVLLDKTTTSDKQQGVSRTMNNNTLSQETPLLLSSPSTQPLLISSPAVSVNEALQDPCASSFTSPRMVDKDVTVGEMQNSFQEVEPASSSIDVVPADQSNHESLVMEPLEQVQQSPSAESLTSNHNTSGETQNTSQQAEPVSSRIDVAPANRSNYESLVMEPLEQAQRLPFAESPSSNQDPSNLPLASGIELQPTNEDSLSSHVPRTSIEVTDQAVLQPASNSEVDLNTTVGALRMHSSDTRNVSTPSAVNNRLVQTATRLVHRMIPPLYSDPLKNELERIRKESEQTIKNHEDMKLQLKSDCEKEIEEIRRKYDIKLQETEVEFQQKKKNLDTNLNIVLMNKILAEAFRSKCMDLKVSGATGMQQDASFAQQLVHLSRQQSDIRPPLVAGPSSCRPPASTLQGSSTTASSQNMMPPLQAAYNASGIFSCVSTIPPHINAISPPLGNHQPGSGLRAPAPHLQPYRPSTSMPATSFPSLSHGMSNQQAPSNIPATPPFPHHPRPTLPTYLSDPHNRMHWPESPVGLPTPNLPATDLRMDAINQSDINLPNALLCMSNVALSNLSKFGTGGCMQDNAGHQVRSADVVCLSDDD